jgi:hypothetical protein
MGVNWFEDLMGFQELSYKETRKNLTGVLLRFAGELYEHPVRALESLCGSGPRSCVRSHCLGSRDQRASPFIEDPVSDAAWRRSLR